MAKDGNRADLHIRIRPTFQSAASLSALALALAVLLLVSAPVPASVITWSGMENNSGWTKALGNWPLFDNAVVHSGTNSMKFVNSGDRLTRAVTATSGDVALRFWFHDADTSSLGGTAPYVDLRGSSISQGFIGFALNSFTGHDITKYHIRGGLSQGSTAYSNGSVTRSYGWHRVELLYKEYSASDHHYTVFVDGVPAFTGVPFTGSATFAQMTVCNGAGNTPCTPQFRVDSLALLGAPRKLQFVTAGADGQVSVAITTPSGLQTGTLAANHTNGCYDATEQLTITAPAIPNYTFSGWTSNCGGSFGNPNSATTTYTGATSDGTVTANYNPNGYILTLQAEPEGSVTSFTPQSGTVQNGGASVSVSAAIAPGYTFEKWTDDPAGANIVSLNPSFTYTMPSANTTLYCWSTSDGYTLTVNAGNGGSVSGDSGVRPYGTPCTVTATADPHFQFLCWSTTPDGSARVSDGPIYSFEMPASDYALYAVFVKAIFYDGFDARNAGSLDSNSAAGPNKSPNGNMNGNPWWGPYPDNLYAGPGTTPPPNSGGQMAYSPGIRNCQNVVNLAYRCNNGSPLYSNFIFDWYFYDPKGSGEGSSTYNDYAALVLYPSSVVTGTADYVNANNARDVEATQRIAVGAWNVGNFGLYHLGVSSGGGTMTWSNLPVPRSIGWHHGRIAVGAANNVSIYIDDMLNSAATLTASGAGFNAIELMARGFLSSNATGYFDDVSVLVPGTQSIDRWLTIGHFSNPDQPSRMTTDYFAPSGTTEANMSPWPGQTYAGKTWAPCNGGVVNWNQIYGTTTTDGASYLFTYINNASGSPIYDADLTCGSDDGIKVWLNGSVVVNRDVYRRIYQDSDRYGPFTLPTGVSRLLVKVTQGSGDYKAQVRLTRADGTPIAGLSYFISESTPPTGSVLINGGAGTTTSQEVTLTLSAADSQSGVATMSFSNDNINWSEPEPYASTKAWTLSVGNGTKTVYVRYTDYCGNSVVVSDTIQLAVAGYSLLLPSNPVEGGSTSGSAFYQAGDTCQASANPNTGYSFVGWSTDAAGQDVVSTANPYNFLMPAQDYTLYAQFERTPYTLTLHANAGGTLGVDPSGPRFYNEPITAVAVPDVGFCFTGWTDSPDGSGTVESKAMAYTFNMPNGPKTLYANFAPQSAALWIEGFETYDAGDIDMNGGPNAAPNGSLSPTPFATNPWFGANPADCQVLVGGSSPPPHGGSKMLYVPTAGYDGQSTVNLSYRLNGDNAYSQSICLDWYFYDPNGTNSGSYYRDFAGLASYPRSPILGGEGSGLDYDLSAPEFVNEKSFQRYWQQFAGIGASWDTSAGYDPTKYQIHVGPYEGADVQGSYHQGWCNTNVTRSVGWHHARVAAGPVKPETGTNDIAFYIDDMDTPAAVKDSGCSLGFNSVSAFIKPAGYLTGYMDDFAFGPLVNPPTPLQPVPYSDGIEWNWSVSPAVQTGSRVYNASVDGSMLQDVTGTTTRWTERGLSSNTLYYRWVTAYGASESARVALTPTYTLAYAPTHPAVSISTTANTDTFYTAATWPGFYLAFPGFGDATGRISKFKYKWSASPVDTIAEGEGTDWAGGTLSSIPAEEGSYWIYFRSYNTAGVGNPETLRMGPYTFNTNPNRYFIAYAGCGENGPRGNPYGPGSALLGESVTVHANPNPGFTFTGWSFDMCDGFLVSTDAEYTFSMPDPGPAGILWIYANYSAQSFTLTVNANTGGTAGTSGTYETEEWVHVQAQPDPNYLFKCWSTDSEGQEVVSTSSSYYFQMPPHDYTLYANFQHRPLLTIENTPTAGGTASGAGRYDPGAAVWVSASVNPGYRLLGWSTDPEGFDVVSTDNPYVFTMPATDMQLYAQYVGADLIFQDSFESGLGAWTDVSTGGYAKISTTNHNLGERSLQIDDIGIRQTRTLAVTTGPLALRFWLKDPGPGGTRTNLIYADMRNGGWGPPLLGISPFSGQSFYQSRGPATQYEDMPLATRLVSSEGNEVWNRVDIALDGAGTARYYVNGVLTKTMSGATPAQIDRIYLGNGTSSGAMTPAYFDDIAFFTNPRLLTTSISPEGGGSIEGYQRNQKLKGATTGFYYENEPIRLVAVPAPGYSFAGWTDGGGTQISTSSTLDLVMPGADLTVSAVFEPDVYAWLTLGKNIEAAGDVTGGGQYIIGDEVTATATVNPGYAFVKWSSDAAGTDELSTSMSYTFILSGTTTIYAIYRSESQNPPDCIDIARISHLWPLANGSTVYGFRGANVKTVTVVWPDSGFWIGETDRSAGIRVQISGGTYTCFDDASKSAIAPGDVVEIYGTLSTPAGADRVFNASYIRDRTVGAGTPIRPISIAQRYIMGSGASPTTPGLPLGVGLYNGGLLVKTAGVVSGSGFDYFYLDDGTCAPGTGIKILCGGLPVPTSGYHIVTGVVGMVMNEPVVYATNID